MISKRVTRCTLTLFTLAGVLSWIAGPALAQEEKEAAQPTAPKKAAEPTLKAGDKAPAVKIEKWLKGTSVPAFEKGKVYVVEFWATWCGPCIQSMPHLSALQRTYKDKGVTIISVNIWEDMRGKPYSEETLKKVEDFVKGQGERMVYTVAYDGKSKTTDKAYMVAADQHGIPAAFVVDKTGTIAWVGHPSQLDRVLEAVVTDKWDPKAETRLKEITRKMATEPKEAAAAWEKFERGYPAVAKAMLDTKFQILLAAGEFDKAYKVAGQIVDEAADKDADKLNEIAWMIVDPESQLEKKDLSLALKAATKADDLSKHENPAIMDTLARAYFAKGDVDKAIDIQTKAVELAKEPAKAQLQQTLDEYKEAKGKK